MRNSSLVECLCAENVPGLSIVPKLRISKEMVGERSNIEEAISRGVVERLEVRMPV